MTFSFHMQYHTFLYWVPFSHQASQSFIYPSHQYLLFYCTVEFCKPVRHAHSAAAASLRGMISTACDFHLRTHYLIIRSFHNSENTDRQFCKNYDRKTFVSRNSKNKLQRKFGELKQQKLHCSCFSTGGTNFGVAIVVQCFGFTNSLIEFHFSLCTHQSESPRLSLRTK